ncbi:hypothetical protein LB518_01670 [Mesorhizobium sp. BR1-1-16]|uniref:hypothetical protein n=1 Tax=Mesorhizobium sp. BR1-1-16 TaxID=2876653 RepID=UPI001CCBB37D|nr:hypothetical protein [Mesorhizobium sp. BR1-1-16]MBZ9934987.1 hypothetical protein [Mesorhizobium sp. BR1-1-16]
MPKVSEAQWAVMRVRYETTRDAVSAIASDEGISYEALWRHAKRAGWARPGAAPKIPEMGDDDRLLGRLFRAFERQVADLEQRFLSGAGSVEEKDARTLSVLARTFETLAKMRDERGGPVDEGSVDLDDLRARLARRLEALGPYGVAAAGADGADGGGDDRR